MKTVLIVEDEKMIRQGIKTMIMRSGVPIETIMECNNGETALEILKEQEIDVMFTDIPVCLVTEMLSRGLHPDHVLRAVSLAGYQVGGTEVHVLDG